MKRFFRQRWLALVLIPFVLLICVYVWLLTMPNSDHITKANYDAIRIGMTITEVNNLMGGEAYQRSMQLRPGGKANLVGAIYMTTESEVLPRAQIILDFVENRVTKKQFRRSDWSLTSLLTRVGLINPAPPPPVLGRPPVPASLPVSTPGATSPAAGP